MKSGLIKIIFIAQLIGIIGEANSQPEMKEGAPLFLEVGEQRILSFPTLHKFSVSGDGIRYFRIRNENKLLIKALKPGLATLYLSLSPGSSETHVIRMEQKKTQPYPPSLLRALNLINRLEVIDGGDHFVIRGLIESDAEGRAVALLRDRFPTFISNETSLNPTRFEKSRTALQRLVDRYPGLALLAQDGSFLIKGGLVGQAQKENVLRQVREIEPLTSFDVQTLSSSDPTLYFKVFLLEVKKELLTQLGIEWPAVHPVALNLTQGQFLLTNPLELNIHALTQKGLVRVLSSPELVVKAPGQAELFAGGELPIRQRSKFNDSIIWKNIGLSLKLDVKEYGGQKVRLTIETEMSHLDTSLKNDEIPGVQTNRIKTLVDGTLGRPLLLSGLLQEDLHQTSKGLTALSSIPILGKLFSSDDFQNSRSEFVAILLPHREPPSEPMQRISSEIPKGFLPLPRNSMNQEEIENAKTSRSYPWNVL